jgi:hypothetical protein
MPLYELDRDFLDALRECLGLMPIHKVFERKDHLGVHVGRPDWTEHLGGRTPNYASVREDE